jgi:DNA-binding NarL/FixJ family response regulator
VSAAAALARGREAVRGRAWADAYECLLAADTDAGLDPADLEMLATAAYMLGRDERYVEILERAHRGCLERGDNLRAARCAFWMGMHLSLRGETARGGGWLGRAERDIESQGTPCAEQGFLLLPRAFRHEAAGDPAAAADLAGEAAAIGRRFADHDLTALALHVQGQFLLAANRIQEGLALLDEAMVAVTGGEVSPIPSGIVYCGVIIGCRDAYDPRRAIEWTAALTRWCESQPDMVAFTGRCTTHRAEIMQLRGEWDAALQEARRGRRRAAQSGNRAAVADAAYLEGDIERLRGRLDAAEAAYRDAHRSGREPQPGLALLRLAQGDGAAALAGIRRALGEATGAAERTRLLPAGVEIMLARGEVAPARTACDELERLAAQRTSEQLAAIAAQARGAVELADGDPAAALRALRRACRTWQELDAPYETAGVRLLISDACRALGDRDAAELEAQNAQEALRALGAPRELARLARSPGGLTARELEVLRLLATGRSNKAIAAELVLSERTIDRHVSNILAKLGVPSRTAAAVYAFEHGIV